MGANRIAGFVRAPFVEKFNRLHGFLVRMKTALYYRRIFAAVGKHSLIYKPLLLSGTQYVQIGAGTLIRPGARIEAIVVDPARPPRIEIGNNVNIEQNVHVVCTSRITIGDNVSITGNCSIVDTVHPFDDLDNPTKIGARIDPVPRPVEIGDGTFVGIGVVILPGVRIGPRCVIGANSTVVRDIPAYSIAVGSPAKVVRRYDFERRQWVSVGSS